MTSNADFDSWSAGQSYERYMGRWSRMIAERFVDWLAAPPDRDWLDIGCGTGALTQTILSRCSPRTVIAIDRSSDFVEHARASTDDPRASFSAADASDRPLEDASIDAAASALVLNFIPERIAALREMQRAIRPGGLLSFYVWDYPGGGVGFIDALWIAAAQIDAAAADLDESRRFPFCTRGGLASLCAEADLAEAQIEPIEISTRFPDFEAFWHPFTLGAGPAPGYCQRLSEEGRTALKAKLMEVLGTEGPISLPARAWAVRTVVH